jgi:saccharopine dehydrogenase (NADP+, L-glutamate forming)
MKRILILGCGRSSSTLIHYLLNLGGINWHIRVGDADENLAQQKVKDYANASFLKFDIFDTEVREQEILAADLVISMLPAQFHIEVLKSCIKFRKNMLSASYISEEIRALSKEINGQGILVIKECGLDPGLDHMSAMQIIDKIKAEGGEITSFKSYTGGLIAPDSDNNPWGYKFTWNPKNVVLAGQGTARYIEQYQYKYIPYHKLFSRINKLSIAGYGEFEGYANRDSLSYRQVYGIEQVPTLLRGTLRRPYFCSAWNVLVQLGLTDDSYNVQDSERMTYRSFLNAFLPFDEILSVEEKFLKYCSLQGESMEMKMISWLGLFEEKAVGMKNASPAKILQKILEEKWVLNPNDKDMIVMQHQFKYNFEGMSKTLTADLVVLGEDTIHTAMSKTVGMPLALVAGLILDGKIKMTGLHIPISKEIYEPVLKELSGLGLEFKHYFED